MRLIRTVRSWAARTDGRAAGVGLGLLTLMTLSFLVSGGEGMVFSIALAMAFYLGGVTGGRPKMVERLLQGEPGAIIGEDRICALADHRLADQKALFLLLEIDSFGDISDRYGTSIASELHSAVLKRLRAQVRSDDSVAQMAPGQFGLLLTQSAPDDLENALQTALRLQRAAGAPLNRRGVPASFTLSGGMVLAARMTGLPGKNALPRAAALALAQAQSEGPNALRSFDPRMSNRTADPALEDDLDIAAAFQRGEIGPWFQPQIEADTGRVTGVETLARWTHPQLGLLTPGRFLSALRDAGFSARLTQAMLEKSLDQLAEWDRIGLELPRVSINLAAEDLVDPALTERIEWALDRSGLMPARLGLEVLETVIANADPEEVTARNLIALGRIGCQIDMDDFGTGSASIHGIRRFDIDRIKIDRSLITGLDINAEQHAMVAAILTMARQLNVDVLAEGVETPGEYAVLAQLGCRHVQGYAIAPPMAAAEFITWLKRHNARVPPPVTPPAPERLRPPTERRATATHKALDGKTA